MSLLASDAARVHFTTAACMAGGACLGGSIVLLFPPGFVLIGAVTIVLVVVNWISFDRYKKRLTAQQDQATEHVKAELLGSEDLMIAWNTPRLNLAPPGTILSKVLILPVRDGENTLAGGAITVEVWERTSHDTWGEANGAGPVAVVLTETAAYLRQRALREADGD